MKIAKGTAVRRRELRSNQTSLPLPLPLPLRRSVRFLKKKEKNEEEEEEEVRATIITTSSSTEKKKKNSATGKIKTHLLQSPSISSSDRTILTSNNETHHHHHHHQQQQQQQLEFSTKCQNELRLVRRSPRLVSVAAASHGSSEIQLGKVEENDKKSDTTRRRSPGLLASLVISEEEVTEREDASAAEKEVNVAIGGSNVGRGCQVKECLRRQRRQQSIRLMGSAKVSEKERDGVPRLSDKEGTREVRDGRQLQKEKEEEEEMGNTLLVKRVRRDRKVNSEIGESEHRKKRMKVDKICKEKIGSKEKEVEKCVDCGGWTKEQEAALNRAYLVANPSPHFWKKVSKMVPGKSAQDCFDRVNGSLETPSQPQPRWRSCRSNLSPIGSFSLSGNKFSQLAVPLAKRLSNRKKTLVAQKTVRHLLKKHSLLDQSHESDYFSVLETSPSATATIFSEIRLPGTPDCIPNHPSFLQKCSGESSAHQKMMSRFKPSSQANQPSPEVLKKIKNVALHEKYIDQLHCREARRKFAKTARRVVAKDGKNDGELKSVVLKAAKTALMSEARDAISGFQHLQANNANVDIDDADDEYDANNVGDEDDCAI